MESPEISAKWSNELQKRAETLPYGIPINLSSDPRNGAKDSGAEFKSGGNEISKWPEGVGFAACFDPEVAGQFAKDASREYRALGITTALGPQIDLCTEPRWMRFVDTLGEEVEMSKKLTKAYCDGMQTTEGEADGWGKDSVNIRWSNTGRAAAPERPDAMHTMHSDSLPFIRPEILREHLKPFTEAAFHLDGPTDCASAVMPYYTVSYGVDKKNGKNVGNSYSEYLIKDLLRGKYEFKGIVA